MKKVFSLMLLFATLMVFLPACSDDKDEPDDIKSLDGELYGTYYVKSLSGKNAELSLTMGSSSMEIRAVKR